MKKSIYGFKQAPRAWFHKLSSYLLTIGFAGSHTNSSLFIKHHNSDILYILVYVDDIIITGSNSNVVHTCITQLSKEFKLRDLGKLHYFLGIEVRYLNNGIILSQQKYLQDLLTTTHMEHATSVKSPMASTCNLQLHKDESLVDPKLYRRTVGALQYACLTRPDLAFVVNKLCQFLSAPTTTH